MTYTIRIFTDNEAFEPNPNPEIIRILRNLADLLENDNPAERPLYDVNGNNVGNAWVEP